MASPETSLRDHLRESLRPPEGPHPGPDADGGTPAAVLVPLIDGDGAVPALLLTERAGDLPRHAGEISFPGGLSHPEDRDLVATALRETEEELGVPAGDVDVLGALDPFLTYTTGFWVLPVVGALQPRPALTPSPAEIAQVLEFPIPRLAEVEAEVEWEREGHRWRGFVYELDGHVIWGATGRMLHEFLGLLARVSPWALSP